MDPIIVVEGSDLLELQNALSRDAFGRRAQPHKLSVHVDGESVKFKVNERVWSPPLGKRLEQ